MSSGRISFNCTTTERPPRVGPAPFTWTQPSRVADLIACGRRRVGRRTARPFEYLRQHPPLDGAQLHTEDARQGGCHVDEAHAGDQGAPADARPTDHERGLHLWTGRVVAMRAARLGA